MNRFAGQRNGWISGLLSRITGGFFGNIIATITADRTWTFQDSTGTVPLLEANQTFTGIQTFAAGSNTAPGVTVSTAGNGLFAPSANAVALSLAGVQKLTGYSDGGFQLGGTMGTSPGDGVLRLNAGLLISGTLTARPTNLSGGATTPGFFVGGTPAGISACAIVRWDASVNSRCGTLILGRVNDGSTTNFTAQASGRRLGALEFQAADGTNLIVGASVVADAEAAWTSGVGPSRLILSTANSAGTVTEFLRGDSNQNVGLGSYAPVSGNGLLQFASGTTKANGIAWGTDTFLYRDASNSLLTDGAFRSKGATSGIGYATGAGGAVTQITSRTTGVTLNTINGEITLVSAAGSAVAASFTVTCSAMAATDHVVLNQKSGTDKYFLLVTAKAAGSFQITALTTGGTTVETPVISFAIVKGVNA